MVTMSVSINGPGDFDLRPLHPETGMRVIKGGEITYLLNLGTL